MVKSQGHLERKCQVNIVFCSYLRGSIYVKPRSKWSRAHSTQSYRRIHFISGNASCLWYLSVIIREAACRNSHQAVHPLVDVVLWWMSRVLFTFCCVHCVLMNKWYKQRNTFTYSVFWLILAHQSYKDKLLFIARRCSIARCATSSIRLSVCTSVPLVIWVEMLISRN